MKRFLNGKVYNVPQIAQAVVVISMLVITSACSTSGGGNGHDNGYSNYAQNFRGDKISVLSEGEAAVINQAGSKKLNSPHFLSNDPYTAISPDEMIRLYGK